MSSAATARGLNTRLLVSLAALPPLGLLAAGSMPVSSVELHACTSEVQLGGETHAVTGWGTDLAAARHAASDDARILAENHDFVRRAGAMMASSQTPLIEGLDQTTREQLVPGAVIGEPECTSSSQLGGSFTASWQGGEALTRTDPASALEAARRRTCLGTLRTELLTTFRALGHAAEDTKEQRWEDEAGAAFDAFATCWTADWESPSAGAGFSGGAGPARCSVLARGRGFDPDVSPEAAAQGFGDTVDEAAEDALRGAVLGEMLVAKGSASDAVSRASSEVRPTLVARSMAQWFDALSGPSDTAERARLACEEGELTGDETLEWQPGHERWQERCATESLKGLPLVRSGESWMAPLDELRDGVDEVCEDNRWEGQQNVIAAVGHASPESRGTLAHAGWGLLSSCEAYCRAATEAPGVAWSPASLDGLPDRTSEEAAKSALDAAIAEQDLDALWVALPALQGQARFAEDDPEAFWELTQKSLDKEPVQWVLYRGQWVGQPDL